MLEADTPKLDKLLDVLNSVSEISGVICFSGDPLQPLMWAHYASSHKGIVLEFDEANPLFKQASFVEWTTTKPVWNIIQTGVIKGKPLSSSPGAKSLDWKYEQEYRLIVICLTPINKPVAEKTMPFA